MAAETVAGARVVKPSARRGEVRIPAVAEHRNPSSQQKLEPMVEVSAVLGRAGIYYIWVA